MLRPILRLGSTAILLGALTACGSGGDVATDPTTDSAAQAAPVEESGQFDTAAVPGASGLIAAVSGTTVQVQSADAGQVAVTFTNDTAITAQVSGTLADVVVGSCVRITSADDQADTDTTTATPTATAVTVTEQVDGTCSAGLGGGEGQRAGGAPDGEAPAERPTDRPTDRAGGADRATGAGFGGRASAGEVSAVDGDSITVEVVAPGETDSTSTVVLVDATTTYTTTQEADGEAVAVGLCVVARGESDTTGAVTAETMSLSDAVDGVCQTGRAGLARAGS